MDLAALNYMQQMQAQQAQPQAQSPLAAGGQAALQNIRDSRALSDQQHNQAMGAALMRYGQQMGIPNEFGNGFSGTVSSMSQAAGPALETYLQQRRSFEDRNQDEYQYAQQLAREQRRDKMEEERLKETKRYHDMYFKKMSDKQTAKEKQNGVLDYIAVPGKGGQNRIIDITRYPVMNKQTESRISKDYADTNSVMNTISDAMKTKKQLDAITKENAFSAVGSTAGSYPSKVKEKWANVQNAFGIDNNASKNLNKEVRLRNLLKTQLEILQVTAERSKSGKAPTDMLMKRFIDKKVLPSVDDVSEDIDNKLKWMNSELKRKSNIDEISLKSKRQIYDELPQEMEEAEETASPAQENEEHPQESASNLATAATLREMFPDFADKDKYPDEKLIRWAKTPEAQKLINGE